MTKAVIFDMDGVLIDSEPFYFERRMNFFKNKGILPGSDSMEDYVGKTEKQIWQLLTMHCQNRCEELQYEYVNHRKSHPIDFSKVLRPSVPMVVNDFKKRGIEMALASSSPRIEIEEMLSKCQLKEYFSFVISGEELQESKPNPEIYLLAKEAMDCEEYIVVEDSLPGIIAAKSAGLYTVALKQAFKLNQKKADVIICSLEELLVLPEILN